MVWFGLVWLERARNAVFRQTDRQTVTQVHLLSSAFAAKNNLIDVN